MSIADEMSRIQTALGNVAEGKSLVADAITAKGVPTMPDASFDTMAVNVGLIEGGGSGGGGITHVHDTVDFYGNTFTYLQVPIPNEDYDHYLVVGKVIGYWYKDSSGAWTYQDGLVFDGTGINDLNIPLGGTIVMPSFTTPAYTTSSGKSVASKTHVLGCTIMVQTSGNPVLLPNTSGPTRTMVDNQRYLRNSLRKNPATTTTSPAVGTRWEYDLYYWND